MERYTIYCTAEQTKKALNLDAPLEIGERKGTILCRYQNYHTYKSCIIPTVEQMIGWLEGLGLKFRVYQTIVTWTYMVGVKEPDDIRWEEGLDSRKEATLAAIDAALEYLIENK